MSGSTQTGWRSRILFVGIAAASAVGAIAAVASPAQAFWVGFPFPGYYAAPYYYYPLPYYYPPPAAYYPPAAYPAEPYARTAQPAPSAYSQPTQPSAYTQEPLPPLAQPSTSATPSAAAQITYTSKPAFRNASGQTCREFTTSDASGKAVYGTACQAADGQWRVTD
jgi:hypothetical protein